MAGYWTSGTITACSWGFGVGTAGFLTFSGVIGSTTTSVNGTTRSISLNQWTHVAVVRSGTTVTLYVNGVADATTGTLSGTLNTPTAALYMGCLNPTDGLYFTGYISNFRIANGTAVYTSNFTPPTAPLTAITNTALLTCQSNYFKDNSSNNFTIAPTGTPSIQPWSVWNPSSPYSTSVNGGSGYFNGTSDFLTLPVSAGLQLGTNNFTMEGWFYIPSYATQYAIFYIDGGTNGFGVRLNIAVTTGVLGIDFSSNGTANVFSTTSTATVPLNQWVHLAYVRNGSTFNGYINGVSVVTNTSSLSANTGTNHAIGARLSTTYGQFLNGYTSNVRIVNGTAVYTTNFTPPTTPLTAITNTSLLLSGTNAGVFDSAIKNDLVTVGSVQIDTTTKKYGTGSIKFNGTTDYLLTPDTSGFYDFGTDDFTVEAWVYVNSFSTDNNIAGGIGPTNGDWMFALQSATQMGFGRNQIAFDLQTTGFTMSVSTWYYVAASRSAGTLKLFINGTAYASASNTQTYNIANPYLCIGGRQLSSGAATVGLFMNGYIDDLRITKGIGRYTTTFTPPTAALPNY
jgi:hypothetical protein